MTPTGRMSCFSPFQLQPNSLLFHFNFNRTHYYFPTTNVSGEPVQVASVACFLLSDAAAYVTGNNVEVSGGLS